MSEPCATLVVGCLLQTVTAVETADIELPRPVVLLGYEDVGDAMVRDSPYRVVLVLKEGVDARAIESVGHVDELLELGTRVVDDDAHVGAMPDQPPAILYHVVGRSNCRLDIGILGNLLIDELTADRIHQRIEDVRTHHQPSFLVPTHGGQVVIGNLRVLRVPGKELVCLRVIHLEAATKCTEPKSVPFILSQCPDTVVGQPLRLIRHLQVLYRGLSRFAIRDTVGQSAIVGTEPKGTVSRCPGTHHDIRRQRTIILVIVGYHLFGLRVIDQDARVVGAQPIVSTTVLTGRRDVAQFHRFQARQSWHILAHAVLIGANPGAAVLVKPDLAQGVVTQCCLVVLIVLELLPLQVLLIHDYQSVVVAGQPDPPIIVNTDVPNLQVFREVLDAEVSHVRCQGVIPLVLLLDEHETATRRTRPEVASPVDHQPVVLILWTTVLSHVLRVPIDVASLTIQSDQFARVGSDHHIIVILSKGRHAIVWIELILMIAEPEHLTLLSMGVVIDQPHIVDSQPEILL